MFDLSLATDYVLTVGPTAVIGTSGYGPGTGLGAVGLALDSVTGWMLCYDSLVPCSGRPWCPCLCLLLVTRIGVSLYELSRRVKGSYCL